VFDQPPPPPHIEALSAAIARIIEAHPAGLSEHQLLQALSEPPDALLAPFDSSDALALFRVHFVVFHVLYRLRQTYLDQQRGWLDISALMIQLHPHTDAELVDGRQAAQADPLAAYYLDLSHLRSTAQQDVEQMLTQFWQRLLHPDRYQAALKRLEASPSMSLGDIRQCFKRLAMRHHPDRGGSAEDYIAIQSAWDIVKSCHSN